MLHRFSKVRSTEHVSGILEASRSWQDTQPGSARSFAQAKGCRHISFRELRSAAFSAASVLRSSAKNAYLAGSWRQLAESRPSALLLSYSGQGLAAVGVDSGIRVGMLLDKAQCGRDSSR